MPQAVLLLKRSHDGSGPCMSINNHVGVFIITACEALPVRASAATAPQNRAGFEVILVALRSFRSFLCLRLFLRISPSDAAARTHNTFSDIRSAEDLNVRERDTHFSFLNTCQILNRSVISNIREQHAASIL